MSILTLRASERHHSIPSDFRAQVRGDSIELPQEVAKALASHQVSNALQLMNFLFTFPSALAQDLGWGLRDVEQARERLADQLHGHLPSALLQPPLRARRASGALKPQELSDPV
jgi:hypothetical protein